MEPGVFSQFDIVVVLGICIGIVVAVFSWMTYAVIVIHRGVKDSERKTRVLASLIVQESETIRTLLAD
jgi:hypothetical protein